MTEPRTVHVEHCMGTVFSFDVRDPGDWAQPVAEAVRFLHLADEIFSTYRADSDISRIRRRELTVVRAHPLVTEVLELCVQAQQDTDGYFSALVDGAIDPTGIVKGWAVEEAAMILRRAGSQNHCVNGGGDLVLAGRPAEDRAWTVGIADPRDPAAVITTVSGTEVAVATSGTAERGAHLRDPHTGRPAASTLLSATVIGPSLTFADAYATAAFVMGRDNAARWIDTLPGYRTVLVGADGAVEQLGGTLTPTA